MKWVDILKETVTQSRVKEIEDIDIDIEDDDCKRKLQRLANKLKNYKPTVQKRWNTGWHKKYENIELGRYSENASLRMDSNPKTDGKSFYLKIYYGASVSFFADFFISYIYKSDAIPESVACRALEILKEEKDDKETIEIDGTYYIIERNFTKNFSGEKRIMTNGLAVYKNEELVLLLGASGNNTVISSSSWFPVEIPLREVSKESGIMADLKFADRWVTR